MIKSLIGVLMLSSSMSLKMFSQNVIYNDNDDYIVLTSSELNDGVFENLYQAFVDSYYEEDLSALGESCTLIYNNVTYYYDIGTGFDDRDVGNAISLSGNDYKFHYYDEIEGDLLPFSSDLRISSSDYSTLKTAIQLDLDEPEPTPTPSYSGLYGHVYDFFYGLFDNEDLNAYHLTIMSVDTTLSMWLAHSVSILLLCLGVLWLILVVRWIFRVFSGLIKI